MTADKSCPCGHDWAAHGPTGCFACDCPREDEPCEVCRDDNPKCPECTMYQEHIHYKRDSL